MMNKFVMKKASLFSKKLTKEINKAYDASEDKLDSQAFHPTHIRESEIVRVSALDDEWKGIDKEIVGIVSGLIKTYAMKHECLRSVMRYYNIVDSGYNIEHFKNDVGMVELHSDFTLYTDGACTAFSIIVLLSEGELTIESEDGSWTIKERQAIVLPDSPYFRWQIKMHNHDFRILSTHVVLKTNTKENE